MKKEITVLVSLIVLFILLGSFFRPNLDIVSKVIDGDTLVLMSGEHVRLLGIDAPELEFDDEKRDTKRECFALESKKFLKDLTLNKKVILKSDPLNKDRDDYGRLLRYVYLENGDFVNQEMLRVGAARSLIYFPFEEKDKFLNIENSAKSQKAGLWNICPQ